MLQNAMPAGLRLRGRSDSRSRPGAALILVILIVLIVGAVGYFVLNKGAIAPTSPYDKVFKSKPAPVAVKPIKTETSKSALISEDGGILDLKDQQEMTLTLPKGALLSPEEIGLRSLKTIDQLPEGSRFIAGAELSPDGLGFVKSSTLSIKLQPGTPTDNLVAFAYEEGGQNFYLQPYSIEEDTIEIPLSGFSGGGVIEIPSLIPVINPGTQEEAAKQLLADVVSRGKGKMIKQIKRGGEGTFDPKLLEEARGILNGWYRSGVKPDLKAAETDDAKVDGAIKQMLSWRSLVELFGQEEYFQKEYQESLDLTARAIKHGVYQSDKRCINQKDPKQVSSLLRWLKLADILGLDGRGGLKVDEIQKKAKNCVVFEIKMDSIFTVPVVGNMKTPAELKGTLALSDDFTHFVGSGTVNEGSMWYSTGAGGSCQTQPSSYGFTIDDTQFDINLQKVAAPKINLFISFGGGGQEVGFDCRPIGPGVSLTIPAPWSDDYFPGFHEAELVSKSERKYFLQNWQYLGSGEIYAQKIYKKTIEGATENTTFTLKHTPRK